MTDQTTTRAKTPNMSYPNLWSDLLLLWRLCDKSACSRARACKGDERRCLPHYFSLLPEGVQDWYGCLARCKKDGVPFDDAIAELEANGCTKALHDWHVAVWNSLGEKMPARWFIEEQA